MGDAAAACTCRLADKRFRIGPFAGPPALITLENTPDSVVAG